MKKINFKQLIVPACFFVAILTLLIVGTFYDFQISKALVDLPEGGYISNNVFGKFFEIIGEMPIYWITTFASAIIFHNFKRRGKGVANIVLCVLSLIVSVGLAYYMSYKLFKYFSQHFDFIQLSGGIGDKIAYAVLGVCYTALLFYLTRKLPSSFLNKMLIWAFIVWLTTLFSQVGTNLLKALAGRPRYRAMFVSGRFDLYRKWFEFQDAPAITEEWKLFYGATSDWFRSFPSGHTSAAATIIPLVLIPALFEKTNNIKSKIITCAVVTLYIALVMLSRIVVGAHFLTDVTVGCLLTFVSFLVSKLITKIVFSKVVIADLKERAKPCLIEEEG